MDDSLEIIIPPTISHPEVFKMNRQPKFQMVIGKCIMLHWELHKDTTFDSIYQRLISIDAIESFILCMRPVGSQLEFTGFVTYQTIQLIIDVSTSFFIYNDFKIFYLQFVYNLFTICLHFLFVVVPCLSKGVLYSFRLRNDPHTIHQQRYFS